MVNRFVNLAVRGLQFIFSLVILGLSVTLIRDHHLGNLPKTLGFAAFVSAVSIIGAVLGIAATWVSSLDGVVGLIIDTLVAIANAIGGIVSHLSVSSRRYHC